MPMTTAARNAVGQHQLGKTDIGALPTLYAGLLKSNPGDAGSAASEVSGGSYGRIEVTSKFGAFADTADGYSTAVSTAAVDFGVPTADWTGPGETLAYIGYWHASSGGTMQFYEQIPNPRSAVNGSRRVRWAPGKLRIRYR